MKWQAVKLSDIAEIVMGQAPSGSTYNEEKNGYPLIAGAGDFGGGVVHVEKYTTEPTKISQNNDIVMSIRASIGEKVWVAEGYCLGRGVAAIRAKNNVDRNYLWHALSYVEPTLLAKGRGATFLQVNKDDIQNLEVPLPPLAEQRRIAEQLDTADRILRLREQAIGKLDALERSVFIDMFGEAESTDKWQRREISAVSSVFTGKTPPTSDIENYADEVPFVTPSDLRGLITSTQRSVSEKGARLIRTVRKGSCLVGCIGDIGKVGYVDMQVTFNQQINAIEWNNTLVDDIYGYFVIKYMEKVFKSKAVSAVVPILNKKNFSCIQIPIPPLNDQHRFSSVVRQIWKIRTDMQNHLPNRLFASLQSQSFAVN